MPFLAISAPTVTTTLQMCSDSDEKRANREKCQRIIDYVFGDGPFPYFDITGFPRFHKEHTAQIIAQQKQSVQEETTRDTNDKQQKESQDMGNDISVVTVVKSNDQPEFVSKHKVRSTSSLDDQMTSLARDVEELSRTVGVQEAKSDKKDFTEPIPYAEGLSLNTNKIHELYPTQKEISIITPTKPFKVIQIKPLAYAEGLSSNTNKVQELGTNQKEKLIIAQTKPFELIETKPLACSRKITNNKSDRLLKEKINTSDDDFLYENSSGKEIDQKLIKPTNNITEKEITSHKAEYVITKLVTDENIVKATANLKENYKYPGNKTIKNNSDKDSVNGNIELDEESSRRIITELTCKDIDNKIADIEKDFQEITIDEFAGDNIVLKSINTSTEGLKREQLKQRMDKSDKRLFSRTAKPYDMSLVQPKIISNKKTTKNKFNNLRKNKHLKGEIGKFQSKHNSPRDDGIMKMEIYMPVRKSERPWTLYKGQSKINDKLNIGDKENEIVRNTSIPLVSSMEPESLEKLKKIVSGKNLHNKDSKIEKSTYNKEPSTNTEEEVLTHCVNTTPNETRKTFSEAVDKSVEALGEVINDKVNIMGDKSKLKQEVEKKLQENENDGNPFKNASHAINTFHFDLLSDYSQNQNVTEGTKENMFKNTEKHQKDLKEKISKEILVTTYPSQTLLDNDHSLPNEKADILPTQPVTFSELQTFKFFNPKPYPQQLARGVPQRKTVVIQNKPAAPTANRRYPKIYQNEAIISQFQMCETPCETDRPRCNKQNNVVNKPWKHIGIINPHWLEQQARPILAKYELSKPFTPNLTKVNERKPEPKHEPDPEQVQEPEPEGKAEPKPESDSKQQISLSSKQNIESENQDKKKREPNKNVEEETDIITQIKNQLSQLYTSEVEIEKKQHDQFNEQESESNDLKDIAQNCSPTTWPIPVPDIKITSDMPLSEMMKAIRMRNQILFIKEFLESVEMSKGGDKKDCPPKAPVCPQKVCYPPVQRSPPPPPPPLTPPTPCTPPPPKPKPQPKCRRKYVRVKDIFGVLPRRISALYNSDALSPTIQSFEQQEDIWAVPVRSVLLARPYDPWVPIPNYPYPQEAIRPRKQCDPRCLPKKFPINVKPKEKPCTGFPKRLTCTSKRLFNLAEP